MSVKRALLSLLSAGVLAGGLVAATPSAAGAYGSDAIYQITFSSTGFVPGMPSAGGGVWGWIELDNPSDAAVNGNDGNFTVSFCGHGGVVGGNGAFHANGTIVFWQVAPGPFGPTLFIVTNLGPAPPFPATPGHYNLNTGPGSETQITVQRITA
jgi:hypothetical protein